MFVKPLSCPEIQLQIVMILPAILVIFVLLSQMSDGLKAGKAEIRKDWNLFQGWTLNSSIMLQLVKVQILTSNVFPPGLMWNYNIKEQDPVKKNICRWNGICTHSTLGLPEKLEDKKIIIKKYILNKLESEAIQANLRRICHQNITMLIYLPTKML